MIRTGTFSIVFKIFIGNQIVFRDEFIPGCFLVAIQTFSRFSKLFFSAVTAFF